MLNKTKDDDAEDNESADYEDDIDEGHDGNDDE